jgi:phosphoglycerate dehydrogenase-like enzyme
MDDGVAMLGGLDRTDELLGRSDYVAITLALNDATRGLIGARELGLMKPTAWLVNVARAEIIDGDALYRAPAERRIAEGAIVILRACDFVE